MENPTNNPAFSLKPPAMQEYRSLVEKCRRQRLSSTITNASASHAGILFENLFAAAADIPPSEQMTLRLRTHQASADFFDVYRITVTDLMDSGVAINVLLDDSAAEESPNQFLTAIKDHAKGEVRYLDDEGDNLLRFVVVGSSAYRVETNAETYEAIANFNDPSIGHILIRHFDNNWKQAAVL